MFTWDVTKAISNYFKHGVSFEYATMVFGDDHALEIEDVKHSQKEHRRIRLEKLKIESFNCSIYGKEIKQWQRNDPNYQREASVPQRA